MISEPPMGFRTMNFLDGTQMIVPADTCRGCLINDMEDQLSGLLEPVFDDGIITVRQDAEWAVPGFMVVGIRPHIGSLDRMDPLLVAQIMTVTRTVRASMRNALGLHAVQMYLEEKLDRPHFHLWMLPLWPKVMAAHDINPRIYESNITEYMSKFDMTRDEHLVREYAARLRCHLARTSTSTVRTCKEDGACV
jgi:diadenosine tetraphosphate (Ap4A) HIT family hydrolase